MVAAGTGAAAGVLLAVVVASAKLALGAATVGRGRAAAAAAAAVLVASAAAGEAVAWLLCVGITSDAGTSQVGRADFGSVAVGAIAACVVAGAIGIVLTLGAGVGACTRGTNGAVGAGSAVVMATVEGARVGLGVEVGLVVAISVMQSAPRLKQPPAETCPIDPSRQKQVSGDSAAEAMSQFTPSLLHSKLSPSSPGSPSAQKQGVDSATAKLRSNAGRTRIQTTRTMPLQLSSCHYDLS
mmetsp:Transcript_40106/g.87600  ORF Transcript_40106/g.87600 Transcript_40106/m.87600 type:complete len:240 (+) Transcript_40106:877-1596(+)